MNFTGKYYFYEKHGSIWEQAHEASIVTPSAASFIALLRKQGKCKIDPADNAEEDGIEKMQADELGRDGLNV